ncbi:MAG: hypothetical protein JSR72_23270 [Proteobacteria bacterium]|nr:hypothetical protein [Pseudomonadota bacterium]
MTTTISDFPLVSDRIVSLGCSYPDSGIAILPINFENAASAEDLRQAANASTIKTLFRNSNVPHVDIFGADKRLPYVHNNAFEWVVPTLFLSASLLSENPNAVSVALGVIANYATDFFKGMSRQASVKLEVVVETTKSKHCKRISYEGPPEGLRDLADVIRESSND